MDVDLNNALSLVAATIFADKCIHTSEVNTFVKSSNNLILAQRFDPNFSEARLLMWYEMNKDDIRQKLAPQCFESWITDLLERLVHVPEKDIILDVMREISNADNELHVSEVALIALAERYWKS